MTSGYPAHAGMDLIRRSSNMRLVASCYPAHAGMDSEMNRLPAD